MRLKAIFADSSFWLGGEARNLLTLQRLKERLEAKHRDRRFVIVDSNDKPIEALNQVAPPAINPQKELTLEIVKERLRRL